MRAVWLKEFSGPEVLVAGDAGCGGRWPTVETLRGLHCMHAYGVMWRYPVPVSVSVSVVRRLPIRVG
jgi:hypothetical protein